jgi:hypothetical protein
LLVAFSRFTCSRKGDPNSAFFFTFRDKKAPEGKPKFR